MERTGIHKIAKLANVSIGTVDRALHGRPGISESTRTRVLGIAKKLSYKPHPAARILSVGRTSLRIGVSVPREIHFFYDQMRAGIDDEVQRTTALKIELVHRPIDSLGTDQREQLTSILEKEAGAVILTPGNPVLIGPLVDEAEEKNVRVMCITTDAPKSKRSGFVGVDPSLSGRLAAELMARFVPDGSRVAMLTGMLSAEEHRLKADGFQRGYNDDAANSGEVMVLEAHESEEESYEKTCDLLEKYPDLKGIYVSTVNCMPVCRALNKYGLDGKVALITTDLFKKMIPHLQDRVIHASIYQDPYLQGQMAVRILVDNLVNGTPIPKENFLNPGIVLRTNLHLFREAQRASAAK
jgi:LacI family transcriptional regulator